MDKKRWSSALFVFALGTWYFPRWNGFLFEPSTDITIGDGRIMATIFLVGGLLLWYLPQEVQKDSGSSEYQDKLLDLLQKRSYALGKNGRSSMDAIEDENEKKE